MSLRKKIYKRTDVEASDNRTGPLNPSHKVDEGTNFVLRTISLETLDEAMYRKFDKLFKINDEQIGLILLDQEVASLRYTDPDKFNEYTQYVKLPYFTCWRANDELFFRTSPSYKKVIYAQPVKKAQGTVYEEYVTKAPKYLKVFYTIKFTTTLREYANQYETQMLELFSNSKTIVNVEGERFHLQSRDKNKICLLETEKRAGQGKTFYTYTSILELWAYTRDAKDMQKRERPNKLSLSIVEKSGDVANNITDITTKLS
jgi:hypothetical protein